MDTLSKNSPAIPTGFLTRPEVYIDFLFEQDLLYILIKNYSHAPAFRVSVKFDQNLIGLKGTKDLSSLAIFQNIEFLAPNKELKVLIDSANGYFNSGQPTKFTTTITYYDQDKKQYKKKIKHDIIIYKDLVYMSRPFDSIHHPF
ncbi:hypothetical protein AAG747_20450 [Rapidithrix thailandica]|uniref:MSP domain-containing protein n=1 Tax=Rapidithrix thailandica TaxID=413964 RepID=A0AAW9RZI2_9BACT